LKIDGLSPCNSRSYETFSFFRSLLEPHDPSTQPTRLRIRRIRI
jgi:hypothetical protein